MSEFAIVDADSQLATLIQPAVAGWQLPQQVATLRNGGALFFAHSLFGDHHNIFPIVVMKVVENQRAALKEKIRAYTNQEFGGPPDIIVYPTESTAGLVVRQVSSIYTKRPRVLALTPAFRRWNRSRLHLEFPDDVPEFNRAELRVLFFDDSISSGGTEEKAFATIRERFLGQIHWRTYTIIDRSSIETRSQRPQTARRRKAADTQGREAYIRMGPPSLDSSRCPLCQCDRRLDLALEWADAGRRGVLAKLQAAKEIVSRRSLSDGGTQGGLIPQKVEETVLLLSYTQFQHACRMVTEESRGESARNVGKFLFVALNFTDACAYVSHADVGRCARAALSAVTGDDSEHGASLLLALSQVPLALLQELAIEVFRQLMSVEATGVAGAVLALLISRHHHQLRGAVRERYLPQSKSEELQRAFVDSLYEAIMAPDPFVDQERGQVRQALVSDLNLLRHQPDQHDQLWNVRVLAALLHLGNHESFLIRELRAMTAMDQNVKDNLLHCLRLLEHLARQLSPGREKTVAEAIAQIENLIDATALRSAGEAAIERTWRHYVETEFIYDSRRLADHLETAKMEASDQLRREGGRSADGLVDLMQVEPHPQRWRVLGPHYKYLVEHFENMFVNAVKHFYPEAFQDWPSLFRRLDQDPAFRAEGPLVRVSFHIDTRAEALFIVFSDRAAPPLDPGLLSKYSGLASCRAHMQIKGGDVFHLQTSDEHPLLPRIFLAAGEDRPTTRLTNHFVTKMPIVLSYKTHREASP